MVFGSRPDEMLQRLIGTCMGMLENITQVVRAGDGALTDLDQALTGTSMAPSESTEQAFLNVCGLLQEALAEAREKGVEAPAVTQKSREVLARINQAEPAWRSPPAMRTTEDMFRMAMRDLRGAESLMKLATGRGEVNDIEALIKWGNDVKSRLGKGPEPEPEETRTPEPIMPPRRRPKKTKVSTPAPVNAPALFARSMAEVLDDQDMHKYASQVESGEMTDNQFIDHWAEFVKAHNLNGQETLENAKQRAIEKGVPPDDEYIKDIP